MVVHPGLVHQEILEERREEEKSSVYKIMSLIKLQNCQTKRPLERIFWDALNSQDDDFYKSVTFY